jgi:hypothetical protein
MVNPGVVDLCSYQQALEVPKSIMFREQHGIMSEVATNPVQVAYLPSSLAVTPETVHAWVAAAEHEQRLVAHRKLPKYGVLPSVSAPTASRVQSPEYYE